MTLENDLIVLDKTLEHFIIPKFLSNNIIIDAGCSSGKFIDIVRTINTKSPIIAIEASQKNIKTLQIKNYCNCTIYHNALVGLNNQPTIVFTEIKGLPEWGSVTNVNDSRIRTIGKQIKYEVPTITLQDIITSDIDYLKMDIEGSETEVIKTLHVDIAKHINQISLEIHNNDGEYLESILQNLNYYTFLKNYELFGIRKELYNG
jgi:FkbM family methyltransferase